MMRCTNFVVALCLLLWPAGSHGVTPDSSCGGAYQVIFIIDGSGGVAFEEFRDEITRIHDCVCGEDPVAAPRIPVDGSVAIGVVQFDQSAERAIPLTVVHESNLAGLCYAITQIDQFVEPDTYANWEAALLEAKYMFDDTVEWHPSKRLVILQADHPSFLLNHLDGMAFACDAANTMRDGALGVRICTYDLQCDQEHETFLFANCEHR